MRNTVLLFGILGSLMLGWWMMGTTRTIIAATFIVIVLSPILLGNYIFFEFSGVRRIVTYGRFLNRHQRTQVAVTASSAFVGSYIEALGQHVQDASAFERSLDEFRLWVIEERQKLIEESIQSGTIALNISLFSKLIQTIDGFSPARRQWSLYRLFDRHDLVFALQAVVAQHHLSLAAVD